MTYGGLARGGGDHRQGGEADSESREQSVGERAAAVPGALLRAFERRSLVLSHFTLPGAKPQNHPASPRL